MAGVKYYYHYLTDKPFIIRTDNSALKYIYNGQKSNNPKLTRYALELAELKFEVEHVPATRNTHADAISRFPSTWLQETERIIRKYDPQNAKRMDTICQSFRDEDPGPARMDLPTEGFETQPAVIGRETMMALITPTQQVDGNQDQGSPDNKTHK